jgi:hypothetical protein
LIMNLIKASLIVLAVFAWIAAGINLANAVAQLPATASTQGYAGPDGSLVIVPTVPPTPTVSTGSLAFSDLISGPDTGLGDGLGSGAIVTVWGYRLGSTQGTSTIEYCDSLSVCRSGHVYYWKNADGTLPSGPANLYESHGMQEIAFSIPDSATGAGTIKVTVDSVESELPFTVRSGNIYHVKSTGNDSAGDGSFANPWLTLESILHTSGSNRVSAGSTIYIHDVHSGDSSTYRGIYWNDAAALSTEAAQFALTAYPNNHPSTTGKTGVGVYNVEGLVVAKLKVFSSNYLGVDANDQPITAHSSSAGDAVAIWSTKNGRTIANTITDIAGGCSSQTAGAIYGNATFNDYVSNQKIYGNEIYEYGCYGSSKLQHTTYLTIRSDPDDLQIEPWQMAWNYLHDNKTKNGLHVFDQDAGCGDLTGDLLIHDNVVVNQAGAGIFFGVSAGCEWLSDVRIYNNVLINTALPAAWDGLDTNTSDGAATDAIMLWDSGYSGTAYVFNNTIYNWDESYVANGSHACIGISGSNSDLITAVFNDNVCYTDNDRPFFGTGYNADSKADNISGSNNALYYSGGTATIPSQFTDSITTNPLLTLDGSKITVGTGSPVINQSSTNLERDIYGAPRSTTSNAGAIQ